MNKTNKGFTLAELVISIVIIGIGIAGFVQLMNTSTINTVDPMLRLQANAIARAYLEEVSLRPFCDPDISNDCPASCTGGNTCTNAACTENTGGLETRATFDDICDYDIPAIQNAVVTDQTGSTAPPIDQLGNYRVTVDIVDTGVNLNGLLGSATVSQSLRIDVTVTHISNADVNVNVSGYRANF